MKILLPLDGSGLAESAIACAQALAQRWQAELVLVSVTEPFVPIGLGPQPNISLQMQDETLAASREYLKSIHDRVDGTVQVKTLHLLGTAREELAAAAEKEGCDLIVMASHGRSGPARWLLGSVAESVLRQATCPVMLLRAPAPEVGEFSNILLPTDGSEASQRVLTHIAPYLAASGKVTLLRSTGLSLQDRSQVIDTIALEKFLLNLEQQLRELPVEGLSVEYRVLDGEAADCILEYARTENCDLIAMSTHGRSGFRRFWLGSVTEKVARQASCPVLAVPGKNQE